MVRRIYVGIDFGGTNVRVWTVDPKTGKILENLLGSDIRSKGGSSEKITTNERLTEVILNAVRPLGKNVIIGCGSAGPVDEKELIVIDSPNASIRGNLTFARELRERGYDITLTNDMRAAAAGARLYGLGRGLDNFVIATFSSGFNCAKMVGKEIITDAEFGHQSYNKGRGRKCGCPGGFDHLESYVSANGAAERAKEFFDSNSHIWDHPILEAALKVYNKSNKTQVPLGELLENTKLRQELIDNLDGREIYKAFRQYPNMQPQIAIQAEQVEAIADAFGRMTSAFRPIERLICMGRLSTKCWDEVMQPAIDHYRENIGLYQNPNIPPTEIVMNTTRKIGTCGAVAYHILQEAA